MQPGNNYRAAASCMINGVDNVIVDQTDADANVAPPPVEFSPMLTVWRQVWLELDSMGPGTDISLSGWIWSINNDSPHMGDGRAELVIPEIHDDGRFEGGTLTALNPTRHYALIDNYDMTTSDHYVTALNILDEDLNHSVNVVDDDTAVLPLTPNGDMAVLNDKYRYAYIEFREDATARDVNNAFVATMPWSDSQIVQT